MLLEKPLSAQYWITVDLGRGRMLTVAILCLSNIMFLSHTHYIERGRALLLLLYSSPPLPSRYILSSPIASSYVSQFIKKILNSSLCIVANGEKRKKLVKD